MRKQSEYPNKAGIYKLIDSNGKIYIGKSTNVRVRINAHKNYKTTCKVKSYLKNAILKYGWDSFTVEILEIVENFDKLKDNDNLLKREAYYIELFDSSNKDKGYNLCKFSTDRTGFPMSEESKRKLSEAIKGKPKKPFTEEHKERMRQAKLGKKRPPFSEEHKEKIRIGNLGKIISEDHKEKLRTFNSGKELSEETKEKISQSKTGTKYKKKNI